MSAGGAFGGSRGIQPIAPEKGVFPLDHFNECRPAMQEYMDCLKNNQSIAEPCRHLSKKYLECRMAKNLMREQDLKELGFGENEESYIRRKRNEESDYGSGGMFGFMDQPKKEGYIAGLKTSRRRKQDKSEE